jgi:hypothetical protein
MSRRRWPSESRCGRRWRKNAQCCKRGRVRLRHATLKPLNRDFVPKLYREHAVFRPCSGATANRMRQPIDCKVSRAERTHIQVSITSLYRERKTQCSLIALSVALLAPSPCSPSSRGVEAPSGRRQMTSCGSKATLLPLATPVLQPLLPFLRLLPLATPDLQCLFHRLLPFVRQRNNV